MTPKYKVAYGVNTQAVWQGDVAEQCDFNGNPLYPVKCTIWILEKFLFKSCKGIYC